MVKADLIARYEILRAGLQERFEQLDIEAAVRDEEVGRMDAELVELEKLLPKNTPTWMSPADARAVLSWRLSDTRARCTRSK